jgi:hypothetical protein
MDAYQSADRMIGHIDLGFTRSYDSIALTAVFERIQIRLISDTAPHAKDSASAL